MDATDPSAVHLPAPPSPERNDIAARLEALFGNLCRRLQQDFSCDAAVLWLFDLSEHWQRIFPLLVSPDADWPSTFPLWHSVANTEGTRLLQDISALEHVPVEKLRIPHPEGFAATSHSVVLLPLASRFSPWAYDGGNRPHPGHFPLGIVGCFLPSEDPLVAQEVDRLRTLVNDFALTADNLLLDSHNGLLRLLAKMSLECSTVSGFLREITRRLAEPFFNARCTVLLRDSRRGGLVVRATSESLYDTSGNLMDAAALEAITYGDGEGLTGAVASAGRVVRLFDKADEAERGEVQRLIGYPVVWKHKAMEFPPGSENERGGNYLGVPLIAPVGDPEIRESLSVMRPGSLALPATGVIGVIRLCRRFHRSGFLPYEEHLLSAVASHVTMTVLRLLYEEELHAENNLLRGILDDQLVSIMVTETRPGEAGDKKPWTVVWANRGAHRLFGADEGELIGRDARTLYRDESDREKVVQELMNKDQGQVEVTCCSDRRRRVPVVISLHKIRTPPPRLTVGIALDKARLHETNILLAAGNVTTALHPRMVPDAQNAADWIDRIESLLKRLSTEVDDVVRMEVDACRNRVSELKESIWRTRLLTEFQVHWSNLTSPKPGCHNLSTVIDRLKWLLHDELVEQQISFAYDQVQCSIDVFCDEHHLSLVLLHLLLNSIEALSEGESEHRIEGCSTREIRLDVTDEDAFVTVHFRDNGPGIPEGVEEGLFEPYMSTKPRGAGFGLAICRNVIERNHGTIDFAPTGRGAAFDIRIPSGRGVSGT